MGSLHRLQCCDSSQGAFKQRGIGAFARTRSSTVITGWSLALKKRFPVKAVQLFRSHALPDWLENSSHFLSRATVSHQSGGSLALAIEAMLRSLCSMAKILKIISVSVVTFNKYLKTFSHSGLIYIILVRAGTAVDTHWRSLWDQEPVGPGFVGLTMCRIQLQKNYKF